MTFGKHRSLRLSLLKSHLLFFLGLLLSREKWHLVIGIVKWLAYEVCLRILGKFKDLTVTL